MVYGFGERKTPKSFVAACDKFIYTEILRKPAREPSERVKQRAELPGNLKDLAPRLIGAVQSSADEAGWTSLGQLGNLLTNHIPDFDPRHYGFPKLSTLIESIGLFEIQKRGHDQNPQIFVRLNRSPKIAKPASAKT